MIMTMETLILTFGFHHNLVYNLLLQLKDSLIEKDPENEETYTKNYDALVN